MSSNPPRLTMLPEWQALSRLREELARVRISALFENDPSRFARFSCTVPGIVLDYSKTRMDGRTISGLMALARACGLEAKRDELYRGEAVNNSEKRAALHMALRGTMPDGLRVDGEDVAAYVGETLEKIRTISERIRADRSITDVIHIGIGGSDLGPRMVCEALAGLADGPRIHFLPNVDGHCFHAISQTVDPKHCVVVVSSKSFTTMETLTNAASVRAWMEKSLPPAEAAARFFGVTTQADAAEKTGIPAENILPMRAWTGGRFSLWSAVGFPIALSLGFAQFERLLAGARDADAHFLGAPLEANIPVLMGMTGIWHRNFWGYSSLAILSYAQSLEHFMNYVQQLDMESNGKGVTRDGQRTDCATGPVIFGETGTNGQHAFMQLLHQSQDIVPAEFIVVAQPDHPYPEHHLKLVSHALAQSKALMDGHADTREPHKNFDGDRPSLTLLLDRLDAYHLGLLLAFYEHKIFVQGVIWGINSFDQWGVELGKTIAKSLIENFKNDHFINDLDGSTGGLLRLLNQKFIKS